MNLLFFDTETTGFPKNGVQPRIIQIAWACYSSWGIRLFEFSSLVSPDGWEVPTGPFWVQNGHSTSRCLESGMPMQQVLSKFCVDAKSCDWIVAHNLAFDAPVLGSEMEKYGMRLERKLHKFCTMKQSADWFGKWPKLIELHQRLFNVGFEGAHDALQDVNACAKCFFEMRKRGIISFEDCRAAP